MLLVSVTSDSRRSMARLMRVRKMSSSRVRCGSRAGSIRGSTACVGMVCGVVTTVCCVRRCIFLSRVRCAGACFGWRRGWIRVCVYGRVPCCSVAGVA